MNARLLQTSRRLLRGELNGSARFFRGMKSTSYLTTATMAVKEDGTFPHCTALQAEIITLIHNYIMSPHVGYPDCWVSSTVDVPLRMLLIPRLSHFDIMVMNTLAGNWLKIFWHLQPNFVRMIHKSCHYNQLGLADLKFCVIQWHIKTDRIDFKLKLQHIRLLFK